MLFLPIVWGISSFLISFAFQIFFFIIIKNKIMRMLPALITFIGFVITVIWYLREKEAYIKFINSGVEGVSLPDKFVRFAYPDIVFELYGFGVPVMAAMGCVAAVIYIYIGGHRRYFTE